MPAYEFRRTFVSAQAAIETYRFLGSRYLPRLESSGLVMQTGRITIDHSR